MSKLNSPAAVRRGRDPKKESYWRERLSHQTQSGLTVRAFCERETLKESAFYCWRREIRRRDRQATGRQTPALAFVEVHAAPMPAAIAAVEHACREPARPDFGQLSRVKPVEGVEHEAPLELVFPGDRRLLIRGGVDAALLARVLAVLEGRSC
jgi:transposase-like protein